MSILRENISKSYNGYIKNIYDNNDKKKDKSINKLIKNSMQNNFFFIY